MNDAGAAWLAGAMVAWFALCWFALPLWAMRRGTPADE
jgi:hypothetical protein